MSIVINIQPSENSLLVHMREKTKFPLFLAYGAICIFFLGLSCGLGYWAWYELQRDNPSYGSFTFFLLMAVGAFAAGLHFTNSLTYSERLFMDKQSIQLVQKQFLWQRKQVWPLQTINNLHFSGWENETPPTTDELAMNKIFNSGNISFFTPTEFVTFGMGYEEDAKPIIEAMDAFLKNNRSQQTVI